ncbi:MAG: alcohol dehydrogenase [Deltaproteobacteria bacterium]|nr:MAG: alcohol dehydrogenase [Deltaproteobacteria bacterium]
MRQVWIPKHGPPEVLEVREAPEPRPKAGEIRIQVAAAGINFADILARIGLYPDAPPLPAVVGYEVAGTVDAVGEGVEGFSVGDRVAALTRFGGYSESVVVPVTQAVRVPEGLSLEKAAAVPVNFLTAWLMLVHLGNIHRGERVLIHSAGGGVGLAAVQIARWRGAEIFGTASAAKHGRLREMGVAHCIDYRREDFEARVREITGGEGVHLVLDAVGGESFRKSYRCLAPTGRLFLFGVSSFAPGRRRDLFAVLRGFLSLPSFKPLDLMQRNRGVFGVNMGRLWHLSGLMEGILKALFERIEAGDFDPVVDRSFRFDEAAQAHRYIQDRKNFGKVLLVP